ncbi:hypothetical protein CHU98_g12237 [Xylaria longipes]|nr:hypothetical protein CHU98_g12237 [Xylaria longipes]
MPTMDYFLPIAWGRSEEAAWANFVALRVEALSGDRKQAYLLYIPCTDVEYKDGWVGYWTQVEVDEELGVDNEDVQEAILREGEARRYSNGDGDDDTLASSEADNDEDIDLEELHRTPIATLTSEQRNQEETIRNANTFTRGGDDTNSSRAGSQRAYTADMGLLEITKASHPRFLTPKNSGDDDGQGRMPASKKRRFDEMDSGPTIRAKSGKADTTTNNDGEAEYHHEGNEGPTALELWHAYKNEIPQISLSAGQAKTGHRLTATIRLAQEVKEEDPLFIEVAKVIENIFSKAKKGQPFAACLGQMTVREKCQTARAKFWACAKGDDDSSWKAEIPDRAHLLAIRYSTDDNTLDATVVECLATMNMLHLAQAPSRDHTPRSTTDTTSADVVEQLAQINARLAVLEKRLTDAEDRPRTNCPGS